jgi:enoyl-CoA hydratase
MNYETLNVETNNAIMTITVNRPKQLNALSTTVLSELRELLTSVKEQDDWQVKGIILTGEGDKAFIAGADIKGMNDMTVGQGEEFGRLGQDVARLLETVPVPVIACVNGYALGGGCEMAMGCDYIFATENAVFGQPEVNLGLIPGFGGCVRLFRYIGPGRAKELIYTGRNVKIDEAVRIGLVNQSFASKDEMLAAANKSLDLVKTKSPLAVAVCKEVINECDGVTIEDGLEAEVTGFKRVFASEDKKEGVAAFVEKRKPEFVGQ